jgi:hypothetical protein
MDPLFIASSSSQKIPNSNFGRKNHPNTFEIWNLIASGGPVHELKYQQLAHCIL